MLSFSRASLAKYFDSLQCVSLFGVEFFEYLRENELLRKTMLVCLPGAQMGSIHEKNRGRKSRETAPLRTVQR